MITKDNIIKDLLTLGIKKGDLIFIRISYKAIGNVVGGPETVLDALIETVGDQGTIVATAFPELVKTYKKKKNRTYVYKPGMKPITGVIPVLMSKREGAFFSSHPTTPYVAIGNIAEELTAIHTPHVDGYYIVKYMVDNYRPKCLRIGGDVLDGTTHIAFTDGLKNTNSFQKRVSEGMYFFDTDGKIQWYDRISSAFCHKGFKKFFNNYIINNKNAVLAVGKVGEGSAMVTDMRETYNIEEKYIGHNPEILLCDDDNCVNCRASFSFSKPGKYRFLFEQICSLFGQERRMALYNIRESLIICCGKKCQ